ncbi:NAD(P)H-dependent oxidoreductase [Ornithinimicrobium faecis]|uniref:NAD(P)H-dependent oxidoreductase n=1 Tax=Ornithinimicrobium faecis TaxID=2934158 RepID=A0ABY4YXA5_9MICO|nr:NAD(P)H-dependent oxidoreductase [Ornithinimicrobium sp. HY1793]USQ81413.1 NAD(P)H-dependent oxidoreductase [Ornithinimicrobium sp. HY1793]
MRALWVLGHPEANSLNGRLRDVGVSALRDDGWDVVESDLYRDGFDPLLVTEGGVDVRREQDKLRAADLLVLQFPLWWYSMPAILKGWVDRVFEAGFAYDVIDPATGRARKYGDGGLAGKRALAVVTAGDRPGSLEPRGISGTIEEVLWHLLHGTFWYTGMDALPPHLVSLARDVDEERMQRLEGDLAARLRGVMSEPRIPYRPLTEEHYDHGIRLLPHVAAGETELRAHQQSPPGAGA